MSKTLMLDADIERNLRHVAEDAGMSQSDIANAILALVLREALGKWELRNKLRELDDTAPI